MQFACGCAPIVPMGAAHFDVSLLGRFAVRRRGEEIAPGAFGGRLVRTLVRILVSRRGTFLSKDVLAEALWPERAPRDPGANLEILMSRARRALSDPSLIVTGPGGYAFVNDERCRVDAEMFSSQVEAPGSSSSPRAALRQLIGMLEGRRGVNHSRKTPTRSGPGSIASGFNAGTSRRSRGPQPRLWPPASPPRRWPCQSGPSRWSR